MENEEIKLDIISKKYIHFENGGQVVGFGRREDGVIVLFSYYTHFGVKGPYTSIPILNDELALFLNDELLRLKLTEGTFTKHEIVDENKRRVCDNSANL